MTVLVTGATGFVATHVIRAVRKAFDGPVVGAARRAEGGGQSAFDAFHSLDLADVEASRRLISHVKPRVVIHLAGCISGTPEELRTANVETARVLLDGLRGQGCDARVVLVGSAAEYGSVPISAQPVNETYVGSPAGAYGVSKLAMTRLALDSAQTYGQWVAIARPFNIIGPRTPTGLVAGALVSRLRAALASSDTRTVAIGRTSAIRDFVAVEDVARGLVQTAVAGQRGEIYNFCSGRGHAISELVRLLLAIAGEEISVEQDPSLLRSVDVDQMVGNNEKARRQLDWHPTIDFEDSVRAAWQTPA